MEPDNIITMHPEGNTPNETQESIVEWATETFGVVDNVSELAARAYEEAAELLTTQFFPGLNKDDIGLELADVFIVTAQIAARFNVRINTSANSRPMSSLFRPGTNLRKTMVSG